jgi:DNA-3-methyladenine glycosylase II
VLEVAWPGPLDIPGSFERFRRHGDDLLDRLVDGTLLRVVDGRPVSVDPGGTVDEPGAQVVVGGHATPAVEAYLTGLFLGDAHALAELAARDEAVAALVRRRAPMRGVRATDPFTSLVRAITAQQVNLAWATTTRARLAERYGTVHRLEGREVRELAPERMASATVEDMRGLQLTEAKGRALIGLAQVVANGELDLDALAAAPDDEVMARLVALRGIGPWTAEWFLARTLDRPRVVAGDLAVRKAVGRLYLDGRMPSEDEVRALTAHWGAAAGAAQELALTDLVAGTLTTQG